MALLDLAKRSLLSQTRFHHKNLLILDLTTMERLHRINLEGPIIMTRRCKFLPRGKIVIFRGGDLRVAALPVRPCSNGHSSIDRPWLRAAKVQSLEMRLREHHPFPISGRSSKVSSPLGSRHRNRCRRRRRRRRPRSLSPQSFVSRLRSISLG